MKKPAQTMAQQVARAISAFRQQRTGHPPKAVTVVLSEDGPVVTFHEALSFGEKTLPRTREGTLPVPESHRQYFDSLVDLLHCVLALASPISSWDGFQFTTERSSR